MTLIINASLILSAFMLAILVVGMGFLLVMAHVDLPREGDYLGMAVLGFLDGWVGVAILSTIAVWQHWVVFV